MGQQEVYQLLKKKKDFVSTDEIIISINSSYNQVIRALAVMLKYGEVDRKKIIGEIDNHQRKVSLWRLR
jgi:predicted transcriptional regulator